MTYAASSAYNAAAIGFDRTPDRTAFVSPRTAGSF